MTQGTNRPVPLGTRAPLSEGTNALWLAGSTIHSMQLGQRLKNRLISTGLIRSWSCVTQRCAVTKDYEETGDSPGDARSAQFARTVAQAPPVRTRMG